MPRRAWPSSTRPANRGPRRQPSSAPRRTDMTGIGEAPHSCHPRYAADNSEFDDSERNDMTRHAASRAGGTDTQLSEEERAIVEVVRDFVDQQVRPQVRELE